MAPNDAKLELLKRSGPRTATVTTEGPGRLLVIGHQAFHSLMDEFPGLEREVLRTLAQRVRNVDPNAVH